MSLIFFVTAYRIRAEEAKRKQMSFYVAFGGGVNSTAMLVGMYERGLEPSWVVFADTGGEKPETYEHVAAVSAWLKGKGHYGTTTVKKESMYASLEDECLRKNTLPALAFGFRSCSDKWKQEPQRKLLNNDPKAKALWDAGHKITKCIGFGVDELHRATPYEDEKYVNWYPMIDWQWNRTDCIDAIKRSGLAVPPKSSCFFCPAMKKREVVSLSKSHPDLYGRALQMERNFTIGKSIAGLGRSFSWSSLSGPETIEQCCICFDGDCEE
jgi:hypothetical protein